MAPGDKGRTEKLDSSSEEPEEILRERLKEEFAQCKLDKKELKRATVDALLDSKINILRTNITYDDMHAIAKIISLCKRLDILSLRSSNLDANLLDILNHGICSSDEPSRQCVIDTIDVHGNIGMGENGLRNLAQIVKKCHTQTIDLSHCCLEVEEVTAFSTALEKAKLSKLIVGYNKHMGKVGYAAIGHIVASSEVQELVLNRCDPTGGELEEFVKSMGSAEIKMIELTEKDTHSKSNWLIPVDEICQKLLPKVTGELRMTGCSVSSKELSEIQGKLNNIKRKGLKVTIGSINNYETLEAGDDSLEVVNSPPSDSEADSLEDPSTVHVDEYGEDTTEKTIEAVLGGSVFLHGCRLEISPDSLENDCTFKLTISNQSPSLPGRYQTISPTLKCESNDAVLKTGKQFTVKIIPWCYAESTFEVFLLRRENQEWKKVRTLFLPRKVEQPLRFPASQLSEWVIAIEPSSEARSVLEYPIHTCIYDKSNSDEHEQGCYIVYFCIHDQFCKHRVETYASHRQMKLEASWKKTFEAKINDTFRIRPSLSAIIMELNGFELTGIFMGACFLPMEFELTPETKGSGEEFRVDILKNDRLAKSCPVRKTDRKRRRTSSIVSSGQEIVSKKHRDETYAGSTGELSGHRIGPEGGEVALDGFTISIPPGALKEGKDFNFGTYLDQTPQNITFISPILICEPDDVKFEKDVTITAPCWFRATDAEKPVEISVFSKRGKEDEWDLVSTKMLSQDYNITFTCRHFSEHVAGMEASDGEKVTHRLEYMLFGSHGKVFNSAVFCANDTVRGELISRWKEFGKRPMFPVVDQIETPPRTEIPVHMESENSVQYGIEPTERKFVVTNKFVKIGFSHRIQQIPPSPDTIILTLKVHDKQQFVEWPKREESAQESAAPSLADALTYDEKYEESDDLAETRLNKFMYNLIKEIADKDWLKFVRTMLGVPNAEIERIQSDQQHNADERKYQMLLSWTKRHHGSDENQIRKLQNLQREFMKVQLSS